MLCQKYDPLAANGTMSWPRSVPKNPVSGSGSVERRVGWDHPLAETAKFGSIRLPDLQAGSFGARWARRTASANSLSFETEHGLWNSGSRTAVGPNRFNAAGNHPLAAHKWNHELAETAIGWS
jgi:hypothetical protein